MKNLNLISLFAATIILSACDMTPTSSVLTFEPPSLSACNPASEVIVKWDVRTVHPEVQILQVFVNDGITEKLFAEGSPLGEAKTGPWAQPGKPRFVLKNKANGKVLLEAAIGGPNCN